MGKKNARLVRVKSAITTTTVTTMPVTIIADSINSFYCLPIS